MIHKQDVSKSFTGNTSIQNLSLEVEKCKILELLGASGASGARKLNTINVLLGFFNPDSEKVQINNIDENINTPDSRKQIGFIPENMNLYLYLSGL